MQMGGSFKHDRPDEVAISEDLNTRRGVERIIRAAYLLAKVPHGSAHPTPRVCMVDKANALPHAHGLWQRTFRVVAAEHREVRWIDLFVDVAAMEFVRTPERFDVVVTSEPLWGHPDRSGGGNLRRSGRRGVGRPGALLAAVRARFMARRPTPLAKGWPIRWRPF